MTEPANKPHYDEEVAQAFLHNEERDNLVIYCLPTIHAYLKNHHWSFMTRENYYDIVQELTVSLILSINSYKPSKNVKLLSWLYTNYRFTMLAIGKKENPFMNNNVQLDEDAPFYVEPEQERFDG